MVRCSTCNVFHSRQLCRFLYCLLRFVMLNSIDSRVQSIRYTMIKLSLIDSVFNWLRLKCVSTHRDNYHAHIVYKIATAKITADFRRISHCLAWFHTVEFNCLPHPNDKIYDDKLSADRFRYQLTMCEIRELVKLSPRLHAHIAYEIVVAKITA